MDNEIAIIAYSCLTPGASSSEELWKILSTDQEAISHFSDEELIAHGVLKNELESSNYIKAKGIIKLPLKNDFDKTLLNLFPFEKVHPQFWVFLKCCQDALKSLKRYQMESLKVAVYASSSVSKSYGYGVSTSKNDYHQQLLSGQNYLAGFISYVLDFHGPAVNIQTACSSSLLAVTEACKEIILGNSDIAIAGGVSVNQPMIAGYYYYPQDAFSNDGRCCPFSHESSGTVMSNGCGVVVLKRLKKAIKDNDTIHGVIRGFAVNNDGNQKVSLIASSMHQQIELLKNALTHAALSIDEVFYIEAHGLGTLLGDLIEYSSLAAVFGERSQALKIGSIKGNIGHLDVASGVISLIKAMLIFKNNSIPATLNFSSLNSSIDVCEKIEVVDRKVSFNQKNPCIGINSFGLGGTNVHVLVERFEN